MNHRLIKQLAEVKGEATIYFKNSTLALDAHDHVIFQVLSEYLHQYGGKSKGDLYYELLRCWYYTLCSLKEAEYGIVSEEEPTAQDQLFYDVFEKCTWTFSMADKQALLYRYPWHLRRLLMASTGKDFVENFVHEVASVHKLEEMDFGDVSYLAITPYDHWALQTIQDDLTLGHEEKLHFQLTKNLSLIPFTLQHFDTFLKQGIDGVRTQDQHGLDILGFLLEIYQEEQPTMSTFQFMLFALSALCFWHFEATAMNGTWLIKQGKFRHLKRIREKLRKLK